ncbi:MAG: DUF1624 domain-containing protein [Flavisolibacter sp.]
MEQVLSAPAGMPVSATPLKRASYRIDSIDLLRGLVMIIMALDHTRDFFHIQAFTGDPTDLTTTTPALFFTRWITHFCAPVFVFLAGTSAYFQSARKSTRELSGFLIKRGLWLVFIEVVIINFAFSFDPGLHVIGLQTIWSIGISMILLGLVIWLPFRAILLLGSLIVLGHNSLDFFEAHHAGAYPISYSLLHHTGFYPLFPQHSLLILYPFLPWAGLMMVGYGFGRLFTLYEGVQRRKILTAIGLGTILFFIALRATNLYGDPDPWTTQKNGLFTVLSFLNTHKYPPSLLYMCMTIGPAILFVAWAGSIKNGLTRFITVYGRVPFFYYVLHFYLIHLLAMLAFLSRGHSLTEKLPPVQGFDLKFVIPGEGYPLWGVYLVWLFVVVSLYPACKWFSEYKKTHTQWWLSYL